MIYTTVKHPKSGEYYAVQMTEGRIEKAAGPLHHSDPINTDAIEQAIVNNLEADEDGEWLETEINGS